MTPRERVTCAIEHEEADRIPIDFGGLHTSCHINAYKSLIDHFGWEWREPKIFDMFQRIVVPDEKLMERFGADVRGSFPDPPDNWTLQIDPEENSYVDEWGIKYRMPPGGFYYDIARPPLESASLEEIKKYKFPDPYNPGRVKKLQERYKELYQNTDYALIIYCPTGGVFEHSYFLRGIEKLYEDMASNLEVIDCLAAKVAEWQMGFWDNVLSAIGEYVQIVQVGEDLGHQEGLLFSPEIYKKYYKPREKMIISSIKKKTNAKIYFHSCGAIYELIPDLIEIGIDILNPVQISAKGMDSRKLKKEFGKDISFWGGGCDPQKILPYRSPKDVEQEVRKRIDDFAPGGGFVFASIHNIQANTPPQNIQIMFETALEYGRYS